MFKSTLVFIWQCTATAVALAAVFGLILLSAAAQPTYWF